MKQLLKTHKSFLLFLLYIPVPLVYFLSQFFLQNHHIIHVAWDDSIPFLPVFIIPYCIWYLYVPMLMLWVYLKGQKDFPWLMITFFAGVYACLGIVLLFPSTITIRPEATGGGFFTAWCHWIFSMDHPVNVFPSMHCFEALAIHLLTFTFGPMKEKTTYRIVSAITVVLICLSTVFVKQHSVIDGIVAVVFAYMVVGISYAIRKRRSEHDNQTL
ncbi:MAG: phosphatase PAP2 family protein [Clostridia bacterium]|nr:phosphatase PAP2 family protein [Clostridia bacterium]